MPLSGLVRRALVAVASLLGLGCSTAPPGRYALAAEPGATPRTEYVRDRVSGRWVYREFEIRVDTTRVLPDPLRDPDHGNALSIQLFKPGSAQTAGLRSIEPRLADGHRVRSGADLAGRPDVEGQLAYGVALKCIATEPRLVMIRWRSFRCLPSATRNRASVLLVQHGDASPWGVRLVGRGPWNVGRFHPEPGIPVRASLANDADGGPGRVP